MPVENLARITIQFTDLDLDLEERNEEAQRLLAQMKHLDEIESVSRVLDPNPPEGNKAAGGFLPGVVATEVKPGNLERLFGFFSDRLSRKPIEIELEFQQGRFKVKANNADELTTALQNLQQFMAGSSLGQSIPAAPAPAVTNQSSAIAPVGQSEATTPPQPVTVFFSYSHKDEALRDELANHLSTLKRQGLISAWYDRDIAAGTEWAGAIDENLNTAQIILLLISANFLASDYCYDIELERAIARHNAGTARVIPIILKPCDWSGAPFGKLQALPKNAQPITTWDNQDEAFLSVAQGIRAAVSQIGRS